MLYDMWRETAGRFRSELALHDRAQGLRWTFEDLARKGEASGGVTEIVYPQGNSSETVLAVIKAWRHGKMVCPLETGQPAPDLQNLPGIAHVKLTSASTGAPRLVCFTPSQLAADARNIVQTMGLRPEWPNLGVISLAHSYGFSNLVLPLLLHGIPLILGESPLPQNVRDAALTLGKFTLPAVPSLWGAWHDADSIPPNVALAISAGAPLSIGLEGQILQRCGIKVHNFYGSTECGGIAYDRSLTARTEPNLIGEPMDNVRLSINKAGCLEVEGEAVGECYWPEGSPQLGNGKFSTSDLAELRAGKVFLLGRASDQINVAGRKMSPEVVEEILNAHPAVERSIVFGVPAADASRVENVVACVSLRERVDDSILKQYLLAKLPSWQVPREWWVVSSIGLSGRGKISRAEWREKFLQQKAAQSSIGNPSGQR